jgi:hypothetical protein
LKNDSDLRITSECTSEEYKVVCKGLISYNNRASKGMIDLPCDEDVKVILKDSAGTVRGGAAGHIALYCFFVEDLWVDENCPLGCGKWIMDEAEKIAKEKGCFFAQTTTFSFQSPSFYRACGYETIAIVDDFPNGVKQHYFKKKL